MTEWRSELQEEFNILDSIFGDDIRLSEKQVEIPLSPATADVEELKHVCMTAVFDLPDSYPQSPPSLKLCNVRGLNEEQENIIIQRVQGIFDSNSGSAMLFEAIDCMKEFLTQYNHPSTECCICLEQFDATAPFTKTTCFHYFHPWCLLDYVNSEAATGGASECQSLCPICRAEIGVSPADLQTHTRPESDAASTENVLELGVELQKFQKQMQSLYAKQKAQGGIVEDTPVNQIDISAVSAKQTTSSEGNQENQQLDSADEIERSFLASNNEHHSKPRNNSSGCDPNVKGMQKRGARNLNSSFPNQSSLHKQTSRDSSCNKNLSQSYNVGAAAEPARIDHKYHDGRWRPRKKHDFEIRAEQMLEKMEKSKSLDESKNRSTSVDSPSGDPGKKGKCVSVEEPPKAEKAKKSLEISHSTPVTNENVSPNSNSESDYAPKAHRVRRQSSRKSSTGGGKGLSKTYSESDYYGYPSEWYYGYDEYQPAQEYFNGNNREARKWGRDRHSFHGNQGRRVLNNYQSGHQMMQHQASFNGGEGRAPPGFDGGLGYDWERRRATTDDQSPKSPYMSAPTRGKGARNASGGGGAGGRNRPPPFERCASTEQEQSNVKTRMGSYGGVAPNSPMLQPMPVLPTPTDSDSVFTYYSPTPPGFTYPLYG